MGVITTVLVIVFCILNFMLFCKIWGACNNTKRIKKLLFLQEGAIRQSYASLRKEAGDFATGDLIYDIYDRLHIIKDIAEDGKFVCTDLKHNVTRIFNPQTAKIRKKSIQLIEDDDI